MKSPAQAGDCLKSEDKCWYDEEKLPDKTEFESKILKQLQELSRGTVIYFVPRGGQIVSFGKNVNYLWPSDPCHSVKRLAQPWFGPLDGRRADGAEIFRRRAVCSRLK